MTATPLLQSALAASREEPDEPVHRAALHDLLVDAGYTDARLLSACLTGRWEGTLAEWWEEGPRVVGLVCVREDGVRLVDRSPTRWLIGGWYWWWWAGDGEILQQDDMPHEWFFDAVKERPADVTGNKWVRYDSPEAAHLDASRRAVRWAMGEARKRGAA